MKILLNLVSFTSLAFLVSCGQDAGSSRKPPSTVINQPIITDSTSLNLRSGIHRDMGTNLLTYSSEITQTFANTLPPTYRMIPLMQTDDEGSSRNVITMGSIGRPSVMCGTGTFNSISARIADCVAKNPTKSTWEGLKNGAAGEGTWKLVAKSSGTKEIWLDTTTGMVWSYLLIDTTGKSTFNWCKASGNGQGPTTTETIDCAKFGENQSLCEGQTLEEVGGQVKWRLPTRNDYLQGDLNGLRFVLTRESDMGVWTATMRAQGIGRSEAWVYSSSEGSLGAGNLTSERQVRCIGAPLM